jgi:hypothetical protein
MFGQLTCPNTVNEFCAGINFCNNFCYNKGFCKNFLCYCVDKYMGDSCEYFCDLNVMNLFDV